MAVDVMAQLRLDKYLADMGIGTRSQIKEAAKKGRIQVNGQTEKKTEDHAGRRSGDHGRSGDRLCAYGILYAQ